MLLVAHTVRHDSTGTSMKCVTYFLTAAPTPHMPALGKGFSISFSQDLFQHASNTSVVASTFSKLPCFTLAYTTSLRPNICIYASTGLFTACMYIHFTTFIILLAYNLKTLTGPITFSVVMVAHININEVTKKHAVPLSKVSNGD